MAPLIIHLKICFMNIITKNGKRIVVNGKGGIVITDGEVFIGGKKVDLDEFANTEGNDKTINIYVEGNVDKIEADNCGKISVTGDVGNVHTHCGDISVSGKVNGNVRTNMGSIECGDVLGDAHTNMGSVTIRRK